MSNKKRVTVTVDPQLVEAGQRAVKSGAVGSVSEWVSIALEEKIRNDHKLAMLDAAVSDFEREFGAISDEEMSVQRRRDREQAAVVRGKRGATAGRSA